MTAQMLEIWMVQPADSSASSAEITWPSTSWVFMPETSSAVLPTT